MKSRARESEGLTEARGRDCAVAALFGQLNAASLDACLEWPVNIGFLNIRILDICSVSYSNIRIYSNIGNIPQFPQNEEKGWSTRVKLHNKILLIQVFKSYHPFFDIIPPFPDIETA